MKAIRPIGNNRMATTSTLLEEFVDELEYADEVTLGRSILQRVPF
jgi:hypothetical protein